MLHTLESLAKINLTDAERAAAVEFFDYFIAKFDLLENVDAEGAEPLVTPSALVNVMREDTAYKTVSGEALLARAPEENNGYYVVPRILE